MHAGSFIYHSHLNDVDQLTKGLYGPMIVLREDEIYDPEKDHIYMIGWKTPDPRSVKDVDLNGQTEQPVQHALVGETHRLRIMHIAPAGRITAQMIKDHEPVTLKYIAKDGADFPLHQQLDVSVTPEYGVGETADFNFTPLVAGLYEFHIGYPEEKWVQTWEVASR